MKNSTFKTIILASFLVLSNSVIAIAQTAPVVDSVATIIGITRTAAFSGCWVKSNGGDIITEKGLCVSTSPNPTIADTKFTAYKISIPTYEPCAITGLTPNTHYYVRAYATNSVGTNYSDQKEFNTSADNIEAVWPCSADLKAIAEGNITASDIDFSKLCTSALFNQGSGGDGMSTINFTGMCKLTTGALTLATFSTDVYNAFSLTANASCKINKLVTTAIGYKSGSIKLQIDYSFDNFANPGNTLLNVIFNDSIKSSVTSGQPGLTSGNPSITTLMGKENIVWPTDINVQAGQTISFRMYVWGKAGSSIEMKNLIVSGTTDLGTGFNSVKLSSGYFKIYNTQNELKIKTDGSIKQYDIIALNGKVIRSTKNIKSDNSVSISDLKSGLYILKVYSEKGVFTGKFIK